MAFTNLEPIRWLWSGPKPPPTPRVDVRSLSSNPTVVRVVAQLQFDRQWSAFDLASRCEIPLANLAPVLREMQRAGIVEAGRFFPGSRVTFYRLKGKQ